MACGFSATASAAARCQKYAAAWASNGYAGTAKAPFRTVQRLVDSLRPGQTGCLAAGTYYGSVAFRRGGRREAPIILTLTGNGPAEVVGRMWIPQTANYVQVTRLHLDGQNPGLLPSPTIDSIGDSFIGDNVTNDHTAICFELGSSDGYGHAVATLLARNRIHDCGELPATNGDHGIYVGNSIGARILGNYIYNNADRGIQLYWNAKWTTVAGNVIDHNGEGITIGGDGITASSNNLITDNVITDSTIRADVESWWPAGSRKGTGNLVTGNCVYGGHGTIDRSAGGFVSRDNIVANPGYADAAASDFKVARSSRCGALLASAATAHARLSNLRRSMAARARAR
jgi:parallel beta-helix repeat protein